VVAVGRVLPPHNWDLTLVPRVEKGSRGPRRQDVTGRTGCANQTAPFGSHHG
jgi:hypothetical protein